MTMKIQQREKVISSAQMTPLEKDSADKPFVGFLPSSKIASMVNNFFEGPIGSKTGLASISFLGIVSVSNTLQYSIFMLAKFIQTLEFSSLLELYNVDYGDSLQTFLANLSEAVQFRLITHPLNNDKFNNWKARIRRGKLSKVESMPYFFQEIGYPGTLLLIVYTVVILLQIRGKKIYGGLQNLRYTLFTCLFVDYLAIQLRTLGQFTMEPQVNLYELFSFILACFVMAIFSAELFFLWEYIRNASPSISSIAPLHTISFEGINKPQAFKNWYSKYYNFLFLFKIYIIAVFIFQMQYIQPIQVVSSLAVAWFNIASFIKTLKQGNFFINK